MAAVTVDQLAKELARLDPMAYVYVWDEAGGWCQLYEGDIAWGASEDDEAPIEMFL